MRPQEHKLAKVGSHAAVRMVQTVSSEPMVTMLAHKWKGAGLVRPHKALMGMQMEM